MIFEFEPVLPEFAQESVELDCYLFIRHIFHLALLLDLVSIAVNLAKPNVACDEPEELRPTRRRV